MPEAFVPLPRRSYVLPGPVTQKGLPSPDTPRRTEDVGRGGGRGGPGPGRDGYPDKSVDVSPKWGPAGPDRRVGGMDRASRRASSDPLSV